MRTGQARGALVIGSEVYSRILDWNDRGTCVLFGDGAGAAFLRAEPERASAAASCPPICTARATSARCCSSTAPLGGRSCRAICA